MLSRRLTVFAIAAFAAVFLALTAGSGRVSADLGEMGSLGEEQVKERAELQDMKDEINDIKATMSEAAGAMGKLGAQVSRQKQVKEFHLLARESRLELCPGTSVTALTYDGQAPGPVIRVEEGDAVRIVLNNQLGVPTSLYFHGLMLPHSVNGLPRKEAGLIGPGDSYAYQFVANRAGTVWYHPQVLHTDQIYAGLSGVLVVEPHTALRSYTKDYVMVIGQWDVSSKSAAQGGARRGAGKTTAGKDASGAPAGNGPSAFAGKAPPAVTYFTVNGKCAPAIPPIEVKRGDRVRLRIVNASQEICPLYLTGHKFELVAMNGSEPQDINARRDTLSVQPGDRYDLEFTADNPGVWSLSSLIVRQTTNDGKFPGGMACVVRYTDFGK